MRIPATNSVGTAEADFIFGSGGSVAFAGGGGSDVLIGAITSTVTLSAGANLFSAVNLTSGGIPWFSGENPLFFDNGAAPHLSVYATINPGAAGWFSVTMGAGATLTVDVDYAGFPTGFRDLVVTILNSVGSELATNDDVDTTVGGLGSIVPNDPFVSFTAPSTGVYFIALSQFDDVPFSTQSVHQLSISLTGQPSSSVTSLGDDIMFGEAGSDQLGGGAGNDQLAGDDGFDWLMGGSGNDVLVGGLNADRLEGGSGFDTFRGTKAEMNGDTIVDLAPGDSILFTDASVSGFTFSIAGNKLNYTGGSLTLTSVPTRPLTLSDFPGALLTVLPIDVRNDINNDRFSDMIIRDTSTGWLTDWLGNSAGFFSNNGNNVSIQFPLDWKVVGTGDYNGDRRDDILLRSDAGWLTNWVGTANGGLSNNGSNTSLFFSPEWKVAGNGDFNGDGRSDLLLRRDDGWLTNWLGTAAGSFANNGANTSLFFTTDWKVASTGDFNGDGYTDILLRRDDGWVTNWLGNSSGGFSNNGANTALFFTGDWRVIGTGDINGDGKDDLVLRRNDGWITDWLGTASGSFTNNGANTALFLATDWKIASIADINGDGREDILLRNDSGWVTDWLGTATGSFVNNSFFSTFIAPNWVVQDPSL